MIIVGGNITQGALMRGGRTMYNLDYIYYAFNNSLVDSGPGGYDLIPQTSVTYDASGAFGQALLSSAPSKRGIYSAQTISLIPESGFTVSIKWKKNISQYTATTAYEIFSINGIGLPGYEPNIIVAVQASILSPYDETANIFVPGGGVAFDYTSNIGVWNHMAYTFNGATTTPSSIVKWYLNGGLAVTNTGTNRHQYKTTFDSITVGQSDLEYSNISIDEIWIFNRELSETEIGYLNEYGTPYPSSITFTATSTTSITIPANATSMVATAIGGGGAGGAFLASAINMTCGGAGGAGGAYAHNSGFAVTPGEIYNIGVGSGGNVTIVDGGDSYVIKSGAGTYKVFAKGGTGKGRTTEHIDNIGGCVAPSVTASVGTTRYAGGNGADGSLGADAGGGGSAGWPTQTGSVGLTSEWLYPATGWGSTGGAGSGISGGGGDIGYQVSFGSPSESGGVSGGSYGGGGGGGFSDGQKTATTVASGGQGVVIYTIYYTY